MTISIHITEEAILVDNRIVGTRPAYVSRENWAELADYINSLSDEDNILDRIIQLTEERDEALAEASEYQEESVGYKMDYDECRARLDNIQTVIQTIVDEGNA